MAPICRRVWFHVFVMICSNSSLSTSQSTACVSSGALLLLSGCFVHTKFSHYLTAKEAWTTENCSLEMARGRVKKFNCRSRSPPGLNSSSPTFCLHGHNRLIQSEPQGLGMKSQVNTMQGKSGLCLLWFSLCFSCYITLVREIYAGFWKLWNFNFLPDFSIHLPLAPHIFVLYFCSANIFLNYFYLLIFQSLPPYQSPFHSS